VQFLVPWTDEQNTPHSDLRLIHIVSQIAHPVLIPDTLPVAQPSEAVLAPPHDVKVLGADVLEAVLEVQDGAGVGARDGAVLLAVLVPGAAVVGPDGLFEEFLGPGVEIGDGLGFGGYGSDEVLGFVG